MISDATPPRECFVWIWLPGRVDRIFHTARPQASSGDVIGDLPEG